MQSDVASYAFLLLVVTLFVFYPASRHNVVGRYPNSILGSPCSIVAVRPKNVHVELAKAIHWDEG